jgi:hypothetical protein
VLLPADPAAARKADPIPPPAPEISDAVALSRTPPLASLLKPNGRPVPV